MSRKHLSSAHQQFLDDSEVMASDRKLRATIAYNVSQYEKAFARGKEQFANLELARRRAAQRRHQVIERLEDHLKAFEHNFTKRGGKVIWAGDMHEARRAILEIFDYHYVRRVVKSKSMVSEEIGLNDFLEKNGIECLETDFGEYIVQLSGERPYHIVTPAMHLSKKDVAAIFHKKFGLSEEAEPEDIMAFVREGHRKKFREAQAGITGANFLVSGTGSVAITENEGNALLTMTYPKIHIVVAGIEKVLSNVEDLELFWPLLATHGTGQNMTAYNTLVNGPRASDEKDGPDQMIVILLDNGRSRLMAEIPQRRSLACIRCGACLNVCPVYRHIGGHAYGTVYSGPIGAVISPHLSGQFREYQHLSFASSLCGKCTEVCPVGIDLHHQLLHNRRQAVRMGIPGRAERYGMKIYKMVMSKRRWLDKPSPAVKNFVARFFFGKSWGKQRCMPKIVGRSPANSEQ